MESGNLVRNADFERAFQSGAPADGWAIMDTPAEGLNQAVPTEGMDGGSCHSIFAPASAEVTWYIASHTVGNLQPGDTAVASVYIRTRDVSDGSGAYFGINYYNEQHKRITWTDSKTVEGTADWTRVEQCFTVPAGTRRVDLALVLHGHGAAYFDRAQVERGERASEWQGREPSLEAQPRGASGKLGAIAILSDDLPPTGTGSDPTYLRELARKQGHAAHLINADGLSDPAVLNAARFDLLILAYGSSFPATAADNLKEFLRGGGSLLTVGGYPLDRLMARQEGAWVDVADLAVDASTLSTLLDPDRDPRPWTAGGRDLEPSPAPVVEASGGKCLRFGTESMPDWAWVTLESPIIEGLPKDAETLAFYASANADQVAISVEVAEADGARWRTRVELSRQWRLHVVSLGTLEYWPDNPSEGRGGWGDHLRREDARFVRFGITTEFVKAKRPYWVDVGPILVGNDPFCDYRRVWLNSARGGMNPATFLIPAGDAISICDPSMPLSDVAQLVPSKGSDVLPAGWRMRGPAAGYSATGQTAHGNPGASLKARWKPILDARDRYGRTRGTGFALMHNFAGEYPGSSWAYSGISDRDLFARGDRAGAQLFASVLKRLIGGGFLYDGHCSRATVRVGERAAIGVRAANLAHLERELSVRLSVLCAGRCIARDEKTLFVPARRAQLVEFPFTAPKGLRDDLLTLTFELFDGTRLLDRLETGAVVWDPKRLRRGPPLTYSDCYFSRGRGPQFLIGTQIYWGNSTVTGTDPLRWDTQLSRMADSGITIARSFTAVPGKDTERGWRYRDALVQLAQDHGVSLLYAGVSWPSTDPDEVAGRAQIAHQAARRYRRAPGWFIDIVNEPYLHIGEGGSDTPEFIAWLRGRYGTFDALKQAWGDELAEGSWEDIKIAPMQGPWESLRAVDTHRFMVHKMVVWANQTRQAAKQADPARLVSVGSLQGLGSTNTSHDAIRLGLGMDFTNRHYYGDLTSYGPDLAQIDMRTLGKAPSTGEFGATSHPGLKAHWVYETETRAIERYAYTVHTCFGLGGAFAANWHWQDPIEDVFPCGLLLADGAPRPRFYTYRNLGLFFGRFTPAYEPAKLYFIIPSSHRFGMSKGPVEQAMLRSLRTLISLHIDFGVVTEETLESLPSSAKALVWPVPWCPSDKTYRAVYEFVRSGGALYVSGDVSFDPARSRTRTQRLEELCGVRLKSQQYANVDYPRETCPVTVSPGSAVGAALGALGPLAPCIAVEPTTATAVAHCGDMPVATLNRVEQGTVLYVTDPVELHAHPRGVLAEFLAIAGLQRHDIGPDAADVQSHRIPGADGALAHVLFNTSDEERVVTLTDLPVSMTITVAPHGGGAALFDANGRLVGVEGRSVIVEARSLIEADQTMALASLDGEDIRQSGGMLLLPLGRGTVRLPCHAKRRLHAATGGIKNGRWIEYERQRLRFGRINLDADQARSWIVLGPKERLDHLGNLVRE